MDIKTYYIFTNISTNIFTNTVVVSQYFYGKYIISLFHVYFNIYACVCAWMQQEELCWAFKIPVR